jgi:hypothetical protein
MGEVFHDNLLNKNGVTGRAYRLAMAGELPIDPETLEAIDYYVVNRERGRAAVMSCIEITSDGGYGLLKAKPELTADEVAEIEDAGVSVSLDLRPILH